MGNLLQSWAVFKRVEPTPEEIVQVFNERRRALDDATQLVTGASSTPVAWRHGWKATVTWLGRNLRRELLVRITVESPFLHEPYVRSLRLVPRRRLNL